jgi:hypothetical protein
MQQLKRCNVSRRVLRRNSRGLDTTGLCESGPPSNRKAAPNFCGQSLPPEGVYPAILRALRSGGTELDSEIRSRGLI